MSGVPSRTLTDQETAWTGKFGDDYTARNVGDSNIAANVALFSSILSHTSGISSALDIGCGAGYGLAAMRILLGSVQLSAVEINRVAADKAAHRTSCIDMHCISILDFRPCLKWDLVYTMGVLIHINPEYLPAVYKTIYEASARYILIAEYYNPRPVEIPYRGNQGLLFKRDFAGEMLDTYSDLRLVSYGFAYHRDYNFPQDDLTWFLLDKRGNE